MEVSRNKFASGTAAPSARSLSGRFTRLCLFACLSIGILGSPASAQEDSADKCEFEGSWGDIEGRNPTLMLITQDQQDFDDKDSALVMFMNEDWSIARGDALGRIRVKADDGGWFDNDARAIENGFAIWTDYEGLSFVFDGSPGGMTITRAGKVVDRLRLSGLTLEWGKFKNCRAKKVAVRAERERQRKLQREIPKDPFEK